MHSVYSAANDQAGKAWAQYLCIVDSGEEIYAFELFANEYRKVEHERPAWAFFRRHHITVQELAMQKNRP